LRVSKSYSLINSNSLDHPKVDFAIEVQDYVIHSGFHHLCVVLNAATLCSGTTLIGWKNKKMVQ